MVKLMKICPCVLTKYRNVMDRRMDGQTDGQTPLDGKKGCAYVQHLAVKTLANQELSHTSANYLHTAGEFSTWCVKPCRHTWPVPPVVYPAVRCGRLDVASTGTAAKNKLYHNLDTQSSTISTMLRQCSLTFSQNMWIIIYIKNNKMCSEMAYLCQRRSFC